MAEEKKVVVNQQAKPAPQKAPVKPVQSPQARVAQPQVAKPVQTTQAKPVIQPQAKPLAQPTQKAVQQAPQVGKPAQEAVPSQKVDQPAPKMETKVEEEEQKFNPKKVKAKIFINIAGLVMYLGALLGFLFPYVMVRIYNVRTQQFDGMDYYGWQLALNFDGTWKNLGTLIPLVSVAVAFVVSLILLIKKIKRLKKEELPKPGGVGKVILYGLLFIGFAGLVTLFLALSSVNIAAPHVNKPYQGHFLGFGAYFTAYLSLLGGLAMFITESGIIKE